VLLSFRAATSGTGHTLREGTYWSSYPPRTIDDGPIPSKLDHRTHRSSLLRSRRDGDTLAQRAESSESLTSEPERGDLG